LTAYSWVQCVAQLGWLVPGHRRGTDLVILVGRHGCGRWNPKNLKIRRHEIPTYPAVFLFSLKVYVMGIHGGYYCTMFSTGHRFLFVFGPCLSERILEESNSPGVNVLVFSLGIRIREVSTGGSPAVGHVRIVLAVDLGGKWLF